MSDHDQQMTEQRKKADEATPRDPRPARARGDDAEQDPNRDRGGTEGLAGALRALECALDKKAVEPVLLDVREQCTYCSYQLVVSGRSDRQVDAISEAIVSGLKADGIRALGTEGTRSGQWALLDFGDFVVHVFHHPVRDHYDLESLWIDAPRVAIEVPADARLRADEY
jgi:ribosome-associated protein